MIAVKQGALMSAGERHLNATFIILRRETSGGYSTRGPIAQPMSLKETRDEIVRLKKLFPHQDFVIMGEIGEATRSERVTVKIEAPDLSAPGRKRRKATFEPNVIPLRQNEGS